MAEPIKKSASSAKPTTPPAGENKLLPVVSQLSQATTSTVKNLTTALSKSVNTAKAGLGVAAPTGKGAKKRGKKWVVWVLILIILALAAGGYYLYTHPTILTGPQPYKNLRTYSTGIVYRSSTIPSGVAQISGSKLTFSSINLPVIDPEVYSFSIRIASMKNGEMVESVNLQSFFVDDSGELSSAETGIPIDSFELGENLAGYNRLQVVLTSTENAAGITDGVLLDGNLGQGVAVLKFPLKLNSVAGQASFGQGEEKDSINIGTNLSGLADIALQAYGWQFESWLVKMDGPWLASSTSLGVFNVVGDEARSSFTTKRDLSGYNKLVVSLVPVGSSGGSLVRLLPFSADITIR